MLINCTPHTVRFNSGRFLEPSGCVVRVKTSYKKEGCIVVELCRGGIDEHEHRVYCGCHNEGGCHNEVVFEQSYGELEGFPKNSPGDKSYDQYIVSAIVLAAAKAAGRKDCLAPATGHPDVIRDEKGQIVSVPGLVC